MQDKSAPDAELQFELSRHLPYLFRHIYAQLEAASAGRLAQFGVNVAVWRILGVLWQHGDLAHRELAELTSIEVSTLSRVSKAVQSDGLIRRKRTRADQRTVRVTLTEKGRDLVRQIIPSAHRMQAKMIGNLAHDDVRALLRVLPVIAENLGSHQEADLDLPEVAGTAGKAAKRARAAKPATAVNTFPAAKVAKLTPKARAATRIARVAS